MNQSKKQSWADRIKKRNKMGFSLVELIVVIAIMAIMTAVLAPSLLSYVERARAQKDDSAMSEVVNSIQLALADQNVYDEVLCYTCDNIKSCYVDKASPLDANRVETKNYGSTPNTYEDGDHFIYNDNERLADESGYVFAGLMRGVTITFEPERSSNKTAFVLYNGYINAAGHATDAGLNYLYGSCPDTEKTSADMVSKGYTDGMMLLGNMHSFSAPTHNYLYNRIRATVGDRIELTSQTYRNSCYTIFIRMGTTGGNQADKQDAIMVYGQWSGTNLSANEKSQGVGNGDIVVGGALPAIGKTTEQYTWSEIKAISEAGKADEYFDLGDIKTMTLTNGKVVEMQIVAFDADEKADGSGKAGITWISKGIINTGMMNSTGTNENGWAASEMRAWLQGAFYGTLPTDVKNVIVSVNKTYYDETSSSTLSCEDNVWIPSDREVFGGTKYEAYGADYTSYFIDNAARGKEGGNGCWWLRSAFHDTFIGVLVTGAKVGYNIADSYQGVVLGFCI